MASTQHLLNDRGGVRLALGLAGGLELGDESRPSQLPNPMPIRGGKNLRES
jgi:hypothetical protein